ncbi:ParB/RepB/Spo0J family partition protein [Polaromonas sp.]|uniref:ParB/RepB/Spo0J family partition protein n=1 Tax=Polaromonas sp. TaxID=1869339 RepID=UPI0013B8F24E|nr:ParB/RepB/Spo0J family partition protein [Polaromonas sp.]NDP63672.1 ParB/RepB/Spo0J family partition protein [Polaromonas sp.]
MARKLFEKGDSISLPAGIGATHLQTSNASRPRTAIGGMAQFVVDESKVRLELESLRAKYEKHEGAKPARLLDPRKIKPSQWANRHEDSFLSEEFINLRAEIENAGGNVQAIKVRPLLAETVEQERRKDAKRLAKLSEKGGVEPFNPPYEYEIVFGHRRHRACLDLGIPVLALIEETTEQELFIDMDRENRLRADLSPWEQGMMYAKALDRGLFPSNARLASAVGRDTGVIGKALALARLPSSVVDAFPTPLEIQYRWAKPLTDRLLADPEAVTHRARDLKGSEKNFSAKEVFELLTLEPAIFSDEKNQPVSKSENLVTKVDELSGKILIGHRGKNMATLSTDSKGRAMVRFKTAMTSSNREALVKLIQEFFDQQS